MNPTAMHAHFATLPGSEQIASAFACEGLAWWLQYRQPTTVYEAGGGIGTLSAIVLATLTATLTGRQVSYTVEESNAWCRQTWDENVKAPVECVAKVFRWTPPARPIDFLIIDGGEQRDDYYTRLARRAIVFFEGNRRDQRRRFTAMWSGARDFVMANWRPADRTKGYWVALLEPTATERVWFTGVRALGWAFDARMRLTGGPVGKRRAA